ncbi:hypothetical protein [Streptomyces sp. AK02-01A]|nr:hypothetical protein [Streptomyces sp. AK02-01A]MDX3854305.1 hypothetical protein [Streptomyces sp. AK02-01A]
METDKPPPGSTTTRIVSRELSLAEAPDGYRHFDARDDGRTKVIPHPAA